MRFLGKNLNEFLTQEPHSFLPKIKNLIEIFAQELCPRTTMRFFDKNLIDVPAQESQ